MFARFRRRKSGEITPCNCCGKPIPDNLPAMAFDAPYYWQDEFANDGDSYLTSDFCCIQGKDFFVRTVLELPIHEGGEPFQYGVWVSLSKKSFDRYQEVFGTKKELKEDPYFGWFSNEIPIYPSCLRIKANVYLRGGGLRPHLLLNHEDSHPLCQEQHEGISKQRAHEIIRLLSEKKEQEHETERT